MVRTDRSFWMYLLLSFITCGIYSIFFFYSMTEDINTLCGEDGETSPNYIVVFLLSLITCGIYYFFWLYKQGNRLQRAGQRYNVEIREDGSILLLWALLGSLVFGIGNIVATYFLINNVNRVAEGYNHPTSPYSETI